MNSGGTSINASQLTDLELIQIAVTGPNPRIAAAVANEVPKALSTFIDETGTLDGTRSWSSSARGCLRPRHRRT